MSILSELLVGDTGEWATKEFEVVTELVVPGDIVDGIDEEVVETDFDSSKARVFVDVDELFNSGVGFAEESVRSLKDIVD